jgi:predicted nucleic acid-binding protein
VKTILDAGPLVAAINRRDRNHDWACDILTRIEPPFYSCEEVLAEASALTGKPAALVEMVRSGDILLPFALGEESSAVLTLLEKYRDLNIDLTDACLIRLSEILSGSRIITMDRDFQVYRRNGREAIPLLTPPQD